MMNEHVAYLSLEGVGFGECVEYGVELAAELILFD
jgi:hypothetical protein